MDDNLPERTDTPTVGAARAGGRPAGSADAAAELQERVIEVVRDTVITVPGVHGIGTASQRLLAGAVRRIPQARMSWAPGLNVAVGSTQIAADLAVVAEPGQVLPLLADDIRRQVGAAVQTTTGLTVVELNVDVVDLHLPEDDLPEDDLPEDVPVPEDELGTPHDLDAVDDLENPEDLGILDDLEPEDDLEPADRVPDDRGAADDLVVAGEPAASPADAAVTKAIEEIVAEEKADSVVVTETVVTTTEVTPGSHENTTGSAVESDSRTDDRQDR